MRFSVVRDTLSQPRRNARRARRVPASSSKDTGAAFVVSLRRDAGATRSRLDAESTRQAADAPAHATLG